MLARRPTGPLTARGVTEIRVGGLAAPSLGVGFEVDMIEMKVVDERKKRPRLLDVTGFEKGNRSQTGSVSVKTQVEGV